MQPAFKLSIVVAALAVTGLAQIGPVQAGELRIGFAAPLSGPTALLGEQMRAGASLAAEKEGAELIVEDDECSAEGGAKAATALVQKNITIVTGFLCSDAIEAALPILKDAGILVITPGVRANGLTDQRSRTLWPVWRTGPRADAEAEAVAKILPRRWRSEYFAIVDDGTLHGRELAEQLRLAAELAGLRPVLVDTFRPQSQNQIGLVGRLARAGVSHVFVGGERDDIAIMARDAASLDHDLVFAGGEALHSVGEIDLAQGTLMIGLPEWGHDLSETVREEFTQAGIIPEGYALPSYASVQIAQQTLEKAKAEKTSLADSLNSGAFDTIIGAIAFDDKGDLAQNPFILQRYDGERFVPVE